MRGVKVWFLAAVVFCAGIVAIGGPRSSAQAQSAQCWVVTQSYPGYYVGEQFSTQPTQLPAGYYVATTSSCSGASPAPTAGPTSTPAPTPTPSPAPVNVVSGTVALSTIGVGTLFAVPTGGTNSVPVALGTPPSGTTGFGFYLAPSSSVNYTFAASQSAAATSCGGGLYSTAANNATTGSDVLWPDNFAGTLQVWICSVTGNARARYV